MSTEIKVDDDTRAAMLLFNERVLASAAAERGKKKIAKAERAKDEAAKEVRRLNDDPDASAEDKAAADAAYKEASDHFQVVQANPNAAEKTAPAEETAPDETPEAEEATSADEPAPSEVSADEEESSSPEASSESE